MKSSMETERSIDNDTEEETRSLVTCMYRSESTVILADCCLVKKHQLQELLGNPSENDDDGFLVDIDVQPINVGTWAPSCKDKWQDIDQFFLSPVEQNINGKMKNYCRCKLCPCVELTSVTSS